MEDRWVCWIFFLYASRVSGVPAMPPRKLPIQTFRSTWNDTKIKAEHTKRKPEKYSSSLLRTTPPSKPIFEPISKSGIGVLIGVFTSRLCERRDRHGEAEPNIAISAPPPNSRKFG